MKLQTIFICFIFVQIESACVPGYETICDGISDLKSSGNSKLVTLTIGNAEKTPTETLKAGTFKHYPNLEELTIIGTLNRIEIDAFRELSKLLVLKLYKNSVSTIADFLFIVLPHLTKLDLQNNNIQQILNYGPFLSTSLKTVNLSFNKLRDLNGQTFAAPGLERLIITNNNIQEIGNKDVLSPDLILLNLDSNELYHIPDDVFKDLHKLEELILSNNRFSTFWTKFKLKSLKTLDFSHNNIVAISEGIFDGLPQLKNLYINHNLIKQLPQQFSTVKIQTLHLHSNRLQNLEMIYNNPTKELRELTLSGNPLPCGCVDNLMLYMELYHIETTPCEEEYLKGGNYPTCIGIDSEWDHGKCTPSDVIEDYIYTFLDVYKKHPNNC